MQSIHNSGICNGKTIVTTSQRKSHRLDKGKPVNRRKEGVGVVERGMSAQSIGVSNGEGENSVQTFSNP